MCLEGVKYVWRMCWDCVGCDCTKAGRCIGRLPKALLVEVWLPQGGRCEGQYV